MIKLYQGDCTEILPHLIGGSNQVIVTDPPFNIGYHYARYKDKLTEEEYYSQLKQILCIPSVVVHYPDTLHKLSISLGCAPTRVVSWVYNSNTAKQHRDIGFYNIKPDFNKVRQPYKNLNDRRIQKRIAEGKTGAKLYDWWDINQVKNVSKDKTAHPCQMPLEVMRRIIGILPEDLTIIDPFMGSGTTGAACKELDRDFIGIEIDPEYFDIASKRLESEAT